jgi:hypothetical protein
VVEREGGRQRKKRCKREKGGGSEGGKEKNRDHEREEGRERDEIRVKER